MAGLVGPSRIHPTWTTPFIRNSGKPELRAIHAFAVDEEDVDAIRTRPLPSSATQSGEPGPTGSLISPAMTMKFVSARAILTPWHAAS